MFYDENGELILTESDLKSDKKSKEDETLADVLGFSRKNMKKVNRDKQDANAFDSQQKSKSSV